MLHSSLSPEGLQQVQGSSVGCAVCAFNTCIHLYCCDHHPYLPVLLQHPVRSIVLPMHDDEAVTISTAVKKALHNLLSPDSVWWQEEHLMHAPIFHATVQEVKGTEGTASQASHVLCALHGARDHGVGCSCKLWLHVVASLRSSINYIPAAGVCHKLPQRCVSQLGTRARCVAAQMWVCGPLVWVERSLLRCICVLLRRLPPAPLTSFMQRRMQWPLWPTATAPSMQCWTGS